MGASDQEASPTEPGTVRLGRLDCRMDRHRSGCHVSTWMVSKCLICELKLKPCSVDDIALDFEYSLRSFRLRSVRVGDTQQRVFLLMVSVSS